MEQMQTKSLPRLKVDNHLEQKKSTKQFAHKKTKARDQNSGAEVK